MEQAAKFPRESEVIMTEMVLPNDTNPLQNLMGGRLMYYMDVAAAIAAQRHAKSVVVTASVDNISFVNPIPMGCTITLQAKVTRAFRSSMEVYIEVFAENNTVGQERYKTNSAFFTFVAVDVAGKPKQVPTIQPETARERKLYEGAKRRRELRHILSGRMAPQDSAELKTIFTEGFPPDGAGY